MTRDSLPSPRGFEFERGERVPILHELCDVLLSKRTNRAKPLDLRNVTTLMRENLYILCDRERQENSVSERESKGCLPKKSVPFAQGS